MKPLLLASAGLFSVIAAVLPRDAPDIRSVPADLEIPKITAAPATAGQRVRETLPAWEDSGVYHVTYLPKDYHRGTTYPVIIEFAGNGGYRSPFGDVSTGLPEGSKLGYGLSGGEGFIWICIPFLTADGRQISTRWWGDAPDYDPQPTLRYCREVVPWICETYRGDPDRIVLAGFSRGAIACNFLGLHDDKTAGLWCGFFAYSHYDGVRRWEYPGSDRASALVRLQRLGNRPQFICHEGTADHAVTVTQQYLESTEVEGDFTFCETGFRNHADAWVLRPSESRDKARAWLRRVTAH